MTTETAQNGPTTAAPAPIVAAPKPAGMILPDSMLAVRNAKRALEAIAQDKAQTEFMRSYARRAYRELNTVLAQYLSENA